jgi:hypothetical protein
VCRSQTLACPPKDPSHRHDKESSAFGSYQTTLGGVASCTYQASFGESEAGMGTLAPGVDVIGTVSFIW